MRGKLTVTLVVAAAAVLDDSRSCNFLTDASVSCALPWPDNFFNAVAWDPAAPPGLTYRNASLPIDGSGVSIDPDAGGYNSLEGFSASGPLMAYFPDLSLDLSGLPRLWNISSSTAPGGTLHSVLLDAMTLQPVAHWVELDHASDDDTGGEAYARLLLMFPSARLRDDTRYIAAFRALVSTDGTPVAASDGFAALRDKLPTNNPALEASRPRFEALFSALGSLGWARSELTLAWDFTTNTKQNVTGTMVAMRDDAFARIAATGGIKYSISSVQDDPAANTTRRVHGQFFVPCYLPYQAVPAMDSRLILDASGAPLYQGNVAFDFEVVIPSSIGASPSPSKVLVYGHGLFGDHGEVEGGYLAAEASQYRYVLAATDWIGLSEYDAATVAVMMATNFTAFRLVPDRLHQGVLNFLVLQRLMTQSDFIADPAMTINGTVVVSTKPEDQHYTGNSQGGIMGSMLVALSQDVTRAVLGVAGGPYALLLPRSTDFGQLFDVIKLRYARPADRISILTIIQSLWDRADPAGYVGYLSGNNTLPGTPEHRVIWHYGLGDAQVTWLGAHMLAHSAGARMFAGQAREGNETLDYFPTVPNDAMLTTGSAIMGFAYGFPSVPFVNTPPTDGIDAHECPRRTPSAQAQMARFFFTGDIVNTCGGPCVSAPPDGCGH